MPLEKLDIISPEITLFSKKRIKHSSIASGILSILGILITICIAIINLVNLFQRKSFTTYFYTRHSNEINTMTFSDKEFFHYIEFYPNELNDSVINIVGVESLSNLYNPGKTFGYPSYTQVNEYYYEKCT